MYSHEGGLKGKFNVGDFERYIVREAARRSLTAEQLTTLRDAALAGNLTAGQRTTLQELIPIAMFAAMEWR